MSNRGRPYMQTVDRGGGGGGIEGAGWRCGGGGRQGCRVGVWMG